MAQATTTTNVKLQTGNRIQIEAGGAKVGFAQSYRASDSYALEPAGQIGDIHTQEHVPTRASHRVTLTGMVLLTGNMRAQGISIQNGDAALTGAVLDVVVYSRDTGLALRAYKSCSYDSGDIDISANRIVMETANFMALDVTGFGV